MDYPEPCELNGLSAIPAAQLLTHSIELSLKLALFKRGYKKDELRGARIRHDLAALMNECELAGVSFSEKHRRLVLDLDKIHKNHLIRYQISSDGAVMEFSMREMVSLAEDFIGASHPTGFVSKQE